MSITTKQTMNILLASVKSLPLLVEGKVAVINADGSYSLYNPSRYTEIRDNYDPMKYSILVHEKYNKCIVYSNSQERRDYLVKKQLDILNSKYMPYRVGDRIHIHSRRGIYELVAIEDEKLKITCDKWRKYEPNPYHYVAKTDFAGLAGGMYNYHQHIKR